MPLARLRQGQLTGGVFHPVQGAARTLEPLFPLAEPAMVNDEPTYKGAQPTPAVYSKSAHLPPTTGTAKVISPSRMV